MEKSVHDQSTFALPKIIFSRFKPVSFEPDNKTASSGQQTVRHERRIKLWRFNSISIFFCIPNSSSPTRQCDDGSNPLGSDSRVRASFAWSWPKKINLRLFLCVLRPPNYSRQLICKWKNGNVFHRQWVVSLLPQAEKISHDSSQDNSFVFDH